MKTLKEIFEDENHYGEEVGLSGAYTIAGLRRVCEDERELILQKTEKNLVSCCFRCNSRKGTRNKRDWSMSTNRERSMSTNPVLK